MQPKSSKIKKYSTDHRNKILLLSFILLVLFTMSKIFNGMIYYGSYDQYKKPHKGVYTNHDYFMQGAGTDGCVLDDEYQMYMYSAFLAMIGDREVVIDNRVVGQNYAIGLFKHTKDNIGVLNTDFADNAPKCQKYYLSDENGQEHKVFVVTGSQWEADSKIKIFYDLKENLIIAPTGYFEEKDFVNIEVQAAAFLRDYTTIMQTAADETIWRIAGDGHEMEISVRQLLFILFIALLGTAAGWHFLAKMGAMAIWFVLPFGFTNQIFSTLLLAVLHLKISLPNYIWVSCLVAVVLHVYVKKYSDSVRLSIKYSRKYAISFLLWAGVVLWFCFKPYIILSYDSIFNEYYAKYAAATGNLNEVLGSLLSYSLITPLYEVGSTLFGIDLNYSLQPIFVVSFMAVMAWIWLKIIKNPLKVKIGVMLWAVLALTVNPMFFIQTFWKLNNLSLGMFVGISVGMHLLYYMTEEKIYFRVGELFFAIVCIARIEGGLFAIVHLVCLYILLKNKDKEKEVENLCLKMALLLTALYFYYFFVIGQTESEFWTPKKGLAMNILMWLVYLFFKILPVLKGNFKKIADRIDIIMPVCISLAVLASGFVDGEKFIYNMFCYICNLGNYGGYWVPVMLIALYGVLRWRRNAVIRFLSLYLISYALLIPALMAFRESPLRTGFGDSACRMLSHIVIVGAYLLIYVVNSWFSDRQEEIVGIEKEVATL